MKNTFSGFYQPDETELDTAWKSDKTLFVFDTNNLLNLYGYAFPTREDFFSILEKISEKIWLPYHVGLEYQRRRLTVIKDEKAIFLKIEEQLKTIEKILDSKFAEFAIEKRFPDFHKETEKLRSDIKELISNYRKSLEKLDNNQPCVRSHDLIREKLNEYFEGKIGPKPESKWLDTIYKEGAERYANKIPPGYKDDKKSKEDDNIYCYAGLKYERRFGDLIIWKQMIEKAKEKIEGKANIEAIIFVSDDVKEDWWYSLDSRGKKRIGPRAELREEICREPSLVKFFAIYNMSEFLEKAKKLLGVDIKDESVKDAENIATFNDEYDYRLLQNEDISAVPIPVEDIRIILKKKFQNHGNDYRLLRNEDISTEAIPLVQINRIPPRYRLLISDEDISTD